MFNSSSRCLEMRWKTVFLTWYISCNSYLILDHSILFLVSDFIPWLYLLFSSVRFFRTFDDELHIKIGLLVPFPIYASICKTLHRYFRLQHFIFFLHPLLPLRSASLHWLSGSRGRLAAETTLHLRSCNFIHFLFGSLFLLFLRFSQSIRHFRVPFYLCFKTNSGAKPFSVETSLSCAGKIISIWKVVHQDSFWNRG